MRIRDSQGRQSGRPATPFRDRARRQAWWDQLPRKTGSSRCRSARVQDRDRTPLRACRERRRGRRTGVSSRLRCRWIRSGRGQWRRAEVRAGESDRRREGYPLVWRVATQRTVRHRQGVHLGIGRAFASVDKQVRERVVRCLVFVIEGDVTLIDDDEVGLALAVMAERDRTTIVGVETGCIANAEIEQSRVTGAGCIVATERIGGNRMLRRLGDRR